MKKVLCLLVSAALCGLISCKSVYEKQGDEHLKDGNPLKALQRYKYVMQKKSGSKDFPKSLCKAYIGAMEKTATEDPNIETMLTYREKISKLMEEVSDPEVNRIFGEAAVNIAKELANAEDYPSQEVAFHLMKDAETLEGVEDDTKLKIAAIRSDFIKSNLNKAEEHYAAAMNDPENNAPEGIIADYILSKMALLVDETAEMKELWSKIRKANLSTYLIYDLENLIENPLPTINRFGVVLAIPTLVRSASTTSIQVQAYNGSTATYKFDGSNFTLVDKEGKEYKPVRKRGNFSKEKVQQLGSETEVGEVTFNTAKDVELSHLRFDSEAGESIKYLP
jgi:hypothetical protein